MNTPKIRRVIVSVTVKPQIAKWLKNQDQTASSLVEEALEKCYPMETVLLGHLDYEVSAVRAELDKSGVDVINDSDFGDCNIPYCKAYVHILDASDPRLQKILDSDYRAKNVVMILQGNDPLKVQKALLEISRSGGTAFLELDDMVQYLSTL